MSLTPLQMADKPSKTHEEQQGVDISASHGSQSGDQSQPIIHLPTPVTPLYLAQEGNSEFACPMNNDDVPRRCPGVVPKDLINRRRRSF